MAIKRVTMVDIAQACGLSRNTVSKIFNNRGAVPEATRQMVLNKAREMGYHMAVDTEAAAAPARNQNIALLTTHMPANYHFGSFFIPAFADQLSRVGYTLTMCEISPEELKNKQLPGHLSLEQTAGILAIELFDREYHEMLCSLGLPVLFVDSFYGASNSVLMCDILSMENVSSTYALCSHLIAAGARNIGFVGDFKHCSSFQARWQGFYAAMDDAGLTVNNSLCILDRDSEQYGDPEWLYSKIRTMPTLPDAFICANDFIAINIMTTLKRHNISIPRDVMVTGFDGLPQSAIVEPSLTTAEIPSADIGRIAAETLLARVENPDRPFRRIYVTTTPRWRDSTGSNGRETK